MIFQKFCSTSSRPEERNMRFEPAEVGHLGRHGGQLSLKVAYGLQAVFDLQK